MIRLPPDGKSWDDTSMAPDVPFFFSLLRTVGGFFAFGGYALTPGPKLDSVTRRLLPSRSPLVSKSSPMAFSHQNRIVALIFREHIGV